jgi:hypothetical protein
LERRLYYLTGFLAGLQALLNLNKLKEVVEWLQK